jgi:hypothetical protein
MPCGVFSFLSTQTPRKRLVVGDFRLLQQPHPIKPLLAHWSADLVMWCQRAAGNPLPSGPVTLP